MAFGAMAFGAVVAQAGPADLAPHRAIYAMGLSTMKSGSGIAAASGTMSYEFDDSCDGWVVENRIAINYAYTEGGQVMSTTDFITWESKDGLHYKFRMRNTRDGQVTEDVEGAADLKGKGQGGVARFIRPEPITMQLPKGTLFPTEHTVRLIDAAQAGGRSFWRVVFDGSGTEGPYEVNALIGGPSQAFPAKVASPLIASQAWPMRLAFFPVSNKDPLPNFEMALTYHPNGVSQEIVQTFKNFSLKGKLQSIEALPKKRC
ncbi:MAG: cell envelope integrity EipB family protein [Rhodospirillaceae bacterium]|nr:cell envelope integrity EipB family protein [Rhodospirillales bacterium]